MKKNVLIMLLTVLCSVNVIAQKGMNGIGINCPFALGQGTTSIGVGVKYQYNFSNYFRIEPSATNIFKLSDRNDGTYDYPVFNAFLNGNIFFTPPQAVRPYFIAGVGYVNYHYKEIKRNNTLSDDDMTDGFDYNVGLGCDFRLNHSLSIQMEAKGMSCVICADDDLHSLQGKWTILVNLGLTYNF